MRVISSDDTLVQGDTMARELLDDDKAFDKVDVEDDSVEDPQDNRRGQDRERLQG
jgi:hypothetical protein